jgi:hypothetical protein
MAAVRPTGPPPEITTGAVVVVFNSLLEVVEEAEAEGDWSSFGGTGSVVVVDKDALLETVKEEKRVESALSSLDRIIMKCAAAIFFLSFFLSFF